MPITITCPQCHKKLQVPDAHAGKKVRCAACKEVIAVPAAEEEFANPDELVEPDEPAPPKEETAVTKTPKRKASWDDDEPEKTKDRDEGYGVDEEDERERKRRKKKKRQRYEDEDEDEDEEIDEMRDRRPRRSRGEPHRSVTVLVLGILSIVVAFGCPLICWILAAIAVNMGNTDKAKMERGVMDRSGLGMNTAGIACAYIGTLLGLINCVAGAVLQGMLRR